MPFTRRVVFFWLLCLCYVVVLTTCQVTLVNRNVTDSFRVGKDGCTNDTSVCPSSATCDQQSGLCLCSSDSEYSYRNPIIVRNASLGEYTYGDTFGCVRDEIIRSGVDTATCLFTPFQVIPYRKNDLATVFEHDIRRQDVKISLDSCSLTEATVKVPDNVTEMGVQWLNNSYVDFIIRNNEIHFKWKRSVPRLQGTIITFMLTCVRTSNVYVRPCLRAKILGTWSTDLNPTNPTVSSELATTAANSNTMTKLPTSSIINNSTSSASSSDDSSTIIVIAVVVPIVLLIVLFIVIWLLCRGEKRNRVLKKSSSRGGSKKKNEAETALQLTKEFRRTDSNLRGLEAYSDVGANQNSTGTFGRPQTKVVENAYANPGRSTPDIERVEINGDLYALPEKKKRNEQKNDNGLNYLDPSALVSSGNHDAKTASKDSVAEPTLYADIVGVLQPKLEYNIASTDH